MALELLARCSSACTSAGRVRQGLPLAAALELVGSSGPSRRQRQRSPAAHRSARPSRRRRRSPAARDELQRSKTARGNFLQLEVGLSRPQKKIQLVCANISGGLHVPRRDVNSAGFRRVKRTKQVMEIWSQPNRDMDEMILVLGEREREGIKMMELKSPLRRRGDDILGERNGTRTT